MAIHLIASARTIDAMKPSHRRLNDGDGLHIRQSSSGRKHWYLDFSLRGKRRSIALGRYPLLGLARARELAMDARRQVIDGIDPVAARKARKQSHVAAGDAGSFQHVAETWISTQIKGWSTSHAEKEQIRLKAHVYPVLGDRPIRSVETKHVANLVETLGLQGKVETAQRVLSLCRRVAEYGVSKGYLKSNPCADVKQILPSSASKHHPAAIAPFQLKPVLQSVADFRGSFVVHCALQFTILAFPRSIELRGAKWDEFDLERHLWVVPAERMKGPRERKLNGGTHYVPLARQAVDLLRRLKPITGQTGYVFAGQGWKNPFISDNTINRALRSVGISTRSQQSGHGFRATARTMLVEQLGFGDSLVELQLDHVVRDPNGRAYNRTQLLQQRAVMMQKWADYLDWLRAQPTSGLTPTCHVNPPAYLLALGFAGWSGINGRPLDSPAESAHVPPMATVSDSTGRPAC